MKGRHSTPPFILLLTSVYQRIYIYNLTVLLSYYFTISYIICLFYQVLVALEKKLVAKTKKVAKLLLI